MSRNFEERVVKYMRAFKCSREEAEQMVRDDDIIDKGGKCDWEVELTPEQKKAQRAARRADRPVTAEKKTRTRAENPDKRAIVDGIRELVTDWDYVTDVVVTNVEREITFNYNGTAYKITLSAPRK